LEQQSIKEESKVEKEIPNKDGKKSLVSKVAVVAEKSDK